MYDFVQVNLLPAEYRVHKRAIKLEAVIVVPALLVAVLLVLVFGWTQFLQNNVRLLEQEIRTLDAQIAQNAPIESEISKLTAEKKIIVGKIMALERISVNRAKWVRLMEMLCKTIPEYTWLLSIREAAGPPPALVLQGKTRSFPEVATFMAALKQSSYVTAVELAKIEQVNEAEKVFGFEITCNIDPNAGLTTVE